MSNVRPTIAGGAQWQETAAKRQENRNATIARVYLPIPDIQYLGRLVTSDDPCNVLGIPMLVLGDEELTITSANVEDLVPKLAGEEWSAATA
jgi:hypothetical protein